MPADEGETLRVQNGTAGVEVDANTLRPDWDGARVNLGWAIDVLHPRAIGH